MTVTRIPRTIGVALVVSLGLSGSLHANDDALSRAKDLYLSAAYEDALALLESVRAEEESPAGRTEAAEYRVFCLLALQRGADAEKAIEEIVSANPFYVPSDGQASPRIRAVFRDVRKGLLPAVVQRTYSDAKAAFDRKDARATELFDRLLTLLDDPDIAGVAAYGDLRTVATGFRDLSRAAATPPPAPPAAVAAPPPASAPVRPNRPSNTRNLGSNVVRETSDAVIPPVALSQPMPRWTPTNILDAKQEFKGTLEIMIDAQGHVIAATVSKSIHPAYDAELIKIAHTWRFKPAMRGRVPTEYLKVIEIQLRPTS